MTTGKKGPPPQAYGSVIEIGEARVKRGRVKYDRNHCTHPKLIYSTGERRIWCEVCECDVDFFDTFVRYIEHFDNARASLKRREEKIKEAESHLLLRRAAKAIDEAWRRRSMVPVCPSCHNGLLPEDFADGCGRMISAEYARAKAKRDRGTPA